MVVEYTKCPLLKLMVEISCIYINTVYSYIYKQSSEDSKMKVVKPNYFKTHSEVSSRSRATPGDTVLALIYIAITISVLYIGMSDVAYTWIN